MALDWNSLAAQLLIEDAPGGDLTTESLGLAARPGRIAFAARAALTAAGIELAAAILARVGVVARVDGRTGDQIPAGGLILAGEGDAAALHRAWKSAQTMIEQLSGIATAARAIVNAVERVDPHVRVAVTRKTFPGARVLSQFAARAGGAIIHRASLSETMLVFPEHRAFLDEADWTALNLRLRRQAPEKKIGIEVGSVNEAKRALDAGFDVIQLERFALSEVEEAADYAKLYALPAVLAAAGGVNERNAADYVRAGARLIVTSAPYSAPPCDVKVTISAL